MKNYDLRHIVFHILIALYTIWALVYTSLLVMILLNAFGSGSIKLGKALLTWAGLNFITGSLLYIVIRLFRNKTLLSKLVLYTYCILGIAGIIVFIAVNNII